MIRNHSRHGSRFPITLGGGGYSVAKSLRFRSSASAYLNRTPATATNQKTWTWSAWVKRGKLTTQSPLFFAGTAATDYTLVQFRSTDELMITQNDASATTAYIVSSALFRDPAAWYHIVAIWNTTSATATATGTTADRLQLWVNGVQVNSFSSTLIPAQNTNSFMDSTSVHYEGRYDTVYFDGEMAEVNFIDGRAVPIAELGASSIYNQWLPIKYTGAYGTNGFYLPFTNTTSTSTLVADSSGNGNNWTPNNISLTAGSTYDSLTDVPTLTSTTVANYAVLNPLQKGGSVNPSSGNLEYLNTATAYYKVFSTIGITSGKWYVEYVIVASSAIASARTGAGLARYDVSTSNYYGSDTYSWGSITTSVSVYNSNTPKSTTLGTFVAGDVLMLAYDADAGKLWFGVKGAWDNGNDPSTGSTPSFSANLLGSTGPFFFGVHGYTSPDNTAINFGQRPFAYTAPSGFLPLNTFNIPAGTVTTSGTFTGNLSTDGPMVYLNGTPTTMTINGNAVTFGTQADKLANGFKVRSSSILYNLIGSNTYTASVVGAVFKYEDAQGNP
jgi:Concanavalin A-like lectin/glucanases superfamily